MQRQAIRKNDIHLYGKHFTGFSPGFLLIDISCSQPLLVALAHATLQPFRTRSIGFARI